MELTDAEKALKGKERVEALQKQSNRAEEFGQKLLEKADFSELAKKSGLKVEVTPEFTEAQPCPDFTSVPQASAEAHMAITISGTLGRSSRSSGKAR